MELKTYFEYVNTLVVLFKFVDVFEFVIDFVFYYLHKNSENSMLSTLTWVPAFQQEIFLPVHVLLYSKLYTQ